MAVNKGEIGIYGILRRDGGDGVLANTDQIYDSNKNLTQQSINSDIYVKLGSKVNKEVGKELISSSDNDKLQYIHYDNNILSIGTHYLSASTNTKTIVIGLGTNLYGKSYLRIMDTGILLHSKKYGDLIAADGSISDYNIYFGNSNKATYIQSSDAIYVSSGIKGPKYTLRDHALQLQIGTVIEYNSISSSVIFNNRGFPTQIMGSGITLTSPFIQNQETNTINLSATSQIDLFVSDQYKLNISSSYLQLGTSTGGLYIKTSDNTYNVSIQGDTSINVESQFRIKNGTGVDIIKAEGTSLVLGNGSYVSADMYMYNYGSNILLSELLNKKYDSTVSRTQNTVLAAPTSNDGAATFRKLELSDIPNLSSKYQVLDQNGFQQSPSIGGALIGYKNNNGYIKASVPSDRNEKVSNSWYYATDGSLQDINTKVTKLNGPKNDTLNVDFTQYTEDPTRYVQTTVQLYGYYSANKPDESNHLNPNVLVTYFAGKHNSTTGYGHQMAYSMSGNTFRRICKLNVWQDWKQFAYTDSDITGNSATATKLKTPVTIWGQSFDGSSNVKGNLSIGGDKLTFGKSNQYYQFVESNGCLLLGKYSQSDMVVFAPQGTYFGGLSAPTEKVEVNGNVKAKEYLLSDGSKYAEACSESDITALFN